MKPSKIATESATPAKNMDESSLTEHRGLKEGKFEGLRLQIDLDNGLNDPPKIIKPAKTVRVSLVLNLPQFRNLKKQALPR